ncbi:hypothetical protein PMO31116_00523 [Pandoraea morbifera]|uniref:Uncharacterized protein n=1 Tax=Pandoraea morbifera TaxID=2508300 RepID=A0A5E4S5W4_9BURK|nr:hypothetical protein [Pandoraea morbifera]VVD69439.1 hypothetical protein PMO31116_00523 [Pandoraea morbifera]
MDEIRQLSNEAIATTKEKYASTIAELPLRQIFRQELVHWETNLKPFCPLNEYYGIIQEILHKSGKGKVSHTSIGYHLSSVAKELGFDRSGKKSK